MPVDLGVELEAARARVEPDDLAHRAGLADRPLERDLGSQRRIRHDLVGRGRRTVLPRLEVERIDVPRLERDRPVVVQLEPVARRGERLAAGGAVDEAEHGAVRAELGAEVLVLERQPVARDLVLLQHKLVRGLDADPVRRRLDDRQLARRRPRDLAPLRTPSCSPGRRREPRAPPPRSRPRRPRPRPGRARRPRRRAGSTSPGGCRGTAAGAGASTAGRAPARG